MQWQQYLLEKIRRLSEQEIKIEEEYLKDPKPIVLVRRNKPRKIFYFRAKPITAYRPTYKQLLTRIKFGEVAKKAKGMKMTGDLPPAAEIVKKELSGVKYSGPSEEKPKKWQLILAAFMKRMESGVEVVV